MPGYIGRQINVQQYTVTKANQAERGVVHAPFAALRDRHAGRYHDRRNLESVTQSTDRHTLHIRPCRYVFSPRAMEWMEWMEWKLGVRSSMAGNILGHEWIGSHIGLTSCQAIDFDAFHRGMATAVIRHLQRAESYTTRQFGIID